MSESGKPLWDKNDPTAPQAYRKMMGWETDDKGHEAADQDNVGNAKAEAKPQENEKLGDPEQVKQQVMAVLEKYATLGTLDNLRGTATSLLSRARSINAMIDNRAAKGHYFRDVETQTYYRYPDGASSTEKHSRDAAHTIADALNAVSGGYFEAQAVRQWKSLDGERKPGMSDWKVVMKFTK